MGRVAIGVIHAATVVTTTAKTNPGGNSPIDESLLAVYYELRGSKEPRTNLCLVLCPDHRPRQRLAEERDSVNR